MLMYKKFVYLGIDLAPNSLAGRAARGRAERHRRRRPTRRRQPQASTAEGVSAGCPTVADSARPA